MFREGLGGPGLKKEVLHLLLERAGLPIQENSKLTTWCLYQTFVEIPGIKFLKPRVVHSSSEITPRVTEWISQKQWEDVATI